MKHYQFVSNIVATALLTLTGAACSSDLTDEVRSANSNEIQFTSVVNTPTGTRAASDLQESQIASGVKVGVFVATSGTDGLTTIDNGNNNSLTADGSGGLTASSTMKWTADQLYFYAYAPYSSENADKISKSISFAVNTDQSSDDNYKASDLLYGVPSSNPFNKSTDGKVTLAFTHKLSKVIITLKDNASGDKKLSAPTVSLMDVVTSGTMTVAGGVFTADKSTSNVTLGRFTSDATSYVAAGVIAPQTVKGGAAFIKVEDNGKTYTCSLSADKAFAEGYVYKYNVTFDGSALAITTDSSLSQWNDGDSTDVSPVETKSYGVGDFVLADGSLCAKTDVASASQSVVGVIFSTTVSDKDKAAGYNAYILSTKSVSKKSALGDGGSLGFGDDYTAPTKWTGFAADLDGLTRTTYIQGLTDYTTKCPIYDFSGESLPSMDTSKFSIWFLPSVGQMVQILNNLGEAKIPTTDDSHNSYCVLPGLTSDTTISSNYMNYAYSTTPTASDLIAKLNAAVGVTLFNSSDILVFSNIFVQTSSSSTVYLLKLNEDFATPSNSSELRKTGWGFANGNTSSSRARLACIAANLTLTSN